MSSLLEYGWIEAIVAVGLVGVRWRYLLLDWRGVTRFLPLHTSLLVSVQHLELCLCLELDILVPFFFFKCLLKES